MQTGQQFRALYRADVQIQHSRITNNPHGIPSFGGVYITTSAYNESYFLIEDNVFEQQVSYNKFVSKVSKFVSFFLHVL